MSIDRLEQAIAKVKNGETEAARPLLVELLKQDPHDEIAWMYLYKTLGSDGERIESLEHCLRLNPHSQWAQKELEQVKARASLVLEEDLFTNDKDLKDSPQPALDPIPPGLFEVKPEQTPSGIDWQKRGKEKQEDSASKSRRRKKLFARKRRKSRKRHLDLRWILAGLAVLVIALGGWWVFFRDGTPAATSVPEAGESAGESSTASQALELAPDQLEDLQPEVEQISGEDNPQNEGADVVLEPPIEAGVVRLSNRPEITPENAASVTLVSQWGVNRVVTLDFSPDGTLLAAGAWDGLLWIWDTRTIMEGEFGRGQERYKLQLPFRVNTVAFSPDGQQLAFGFSTINEPVRIVDLQSLAGASGPVEELPIHTLSGHQDGVKSVVFSPNGRLLVSASFDETVRFWDAQSGTELSEISGYYVEHMAFSSDGKLLATAYFDAGYSTILWDLSEMSADQGWRPRQVAVLDGGPGLTFTPDGAQLATAEERISIWEAGALSGSVPPPILTLPGHTELVQSLALSPDGRILASAARDRQIKLWDTQSGQVLATLVGHGDRVRWVRFSPDGSLVASASDDGTLRLWGVRRPAEN